MSEDYRDIVLKQKMLNDIYKLERGKQGDIDIKSDEQDKQQSLIKRLEKKPDRLEGETDEDYQARINQWEARIGTKVKQDMAKERDLLLKNFQRIMSPSEAGEMMSFPQITEENIKKLNQHWKAFEEELRKKYSSIDFDILEEFIIKYIETVDNGDNLSQEIKRGFLAMRDRLDEITVGLEEKTEALEEVINSAANRNNASLFRVHNLLATLIKNKANLTDQQIQQQSARILTAISDASENVDSKTQRVLDGIESAVNTINGSIASSENAVKGSVKASERRIKSSIGRSVERLIQQFNQSNDRISFELQTRLGQMMMALQQNNIDLVNEKTAEITQIINEAQKLSSREMSASTKQLLEQTKKIIGTVRNDVNNARLDVNTLRDDVNTLRDDVNQNRDVLRYDLDTQIQRVISNQSRALDRIMSARGEETPTILEERQYTSTAEGNSNDVQQRQRELERELELARLEDFDIDRDQALSPNKYSSTKLYTYDEVIQQFHKNRTLYDNIRNKLHNVNSKHDMMVRARQYSGIIPQGAPFLRGFEAIIFNNKNPYQVSDNDIDRYILPLIAFERNTYIENNPRVKAGDRNKNASVNNGSRPIYGAGGAVLNTHSPNKIIIGKGLDNSNDDLTFGRYIINSDKLNQNNLLITYHNTSMNRVKYFPQKIVSDEMKDLINYIVSKKKYNDKLFNMLDDEEKLLFKNMFNKSGLSKMMNVKIFDDSSKQAKKDYENLKETYYIIEGEINAGNNSPTLVKQLNDITKQLKKQIVYMNKIGLMGLKESNNLILSL